MPTCTGPDEGPAADGREAGLWSLDPESVEDLYNRAPCGYLITLADGTVARVNQTFLDWTGYEEQEVVGRMRFVDLLRPGGQIFHETHFAPLLRLQGEVSEIALDVVRRDGETLPTLVSAQAREGGGETQEHTRITVFNASQRRQYEAELLWARKAAEASEQQLRVVAQTLQRSLMHGGLSGGEGFQIATRYRPAVDTLEVGGDWHDSFLLGDGITVGVSVGDVVGRGIRAACAMGQLRSALRALAGSGLGPARLLDQLHDFAAGVPDAQVATIAYAEVNTLTREVRYACAGHLPPLVLGADGRTEFLWEGRSMPLAAVSGAPPRSEATDTLLPGSRLVLYTDGLIERRRREIDDGLGALSEAASRLGHEPLEVMADRLMADLLADEDNPDDVCLLAIQLGS